jgi:hypothetical protein
MQDNCQLQAMLTKVANVFSSLQLGQGEAQERKSI